MEDIAKEFSEDENRRRFLALSPSERLAEISRTQQARWDELRQSPERYAKFLARNFKKRAIDENGDYCDPEARALAAQGDRLNEPALRESASAALGFILSDT